MSTMSATCTSDWPTPMVSTNTTSNPAASTTMIDSRVALVTPPSTPALGDGRMNARSSAASRDMRVLSPRMLPPVRVDDGSTARTATRVPLAVSSLPRASMNVDFPAPGTPVTPMRWLPPARRSKRTSSSLAAS